MVLAIGGLWLGARSASAAITHPFLSSFDGSGTPAGSFQPVGVAVDNSAGPAAGEVYVDDGGSHKVVDRFSAGGAYDCQITGRGSASATTASPSECDGATSGTPSGTFGSLQGEPAIDPASGDVWVPDSAGHVVDEFGPGGSYLGQVTVPNRGAPKAVAVDSAGDLYVVDSGNQVVDRYDPSSSSWITFATGTPSGSFGFQLTGVAVDLDPSSPSFGDVYVADSFPDQVVDVFSSSGSFLRQLTGTPAGSFGFSLNVAVDPTSGELYVTEGNQSHVLDEFSATGSFEGQIRVPGSPNPSDPTAVAVSAATGDVYVADDQNNVVAVFDPGEIIPDVTTGTASNLQPTSATVSGTVSPDGIQVTDCHFDWGTSSAYGNTAPCAETVGSGTSPVPVHADLSSLTPGTTYHFRLVAANASGSNTDSPPADQTFSTPPPPAITDAHAANVTSSSASLEANINPGGNDTTYHIEWGTSTSYGIVMPVPDADIGSGTSAVAVTPHLTGLTANTTYHWRIVAKNVAGTTTSPDHTFIYSTTGGGLPDNRGYEQVTPVHKNGAQFDVGVFMPPPAVSSNGNRVVAASIQCLPGAQSCTANREIEGEVFALDRTPHGWTSRDLSPPATQFNANTPWGYNPDQNTALFSANVTPSSKDELVGRLSDGSLRVFGPALSPSSTSIRPGDALILGTPDLSRVVFADDVNSLDWPFDSTARSGVRSSTFEYVGGGNSEPTLVGVSGGPGSTDLVSQCGTDLDSLSADGRTVVFTASGPSFCPSTAAAPAVDEVLARIDESRTVLLSGRSTDDCTSSACQSSAAEDATFQSASDDGSKVLFSSTQQLTDDATQGSTNLYLYDFDNPAGHELVDVSPGDTSGTGPDVQGVMAQSPDGSHTYFVASGVLTGSVNGQGQRPAAGADNLYVYQRDAAHPAGQVRFIATLSPFDGNEWNSAGGGPNVTQDGRFLVFTSQAALTADDSSVSGAAQIFRYDAQAGQLIRLSIGEGGFDDNGNAGDSSLCAGQTFGCNADASIARPTTVLRRDPTMSNDGAYVFFQSPAGLTPQALDYVQNGTAPITNDPVYAQNVYEWHDGHIYLISDGKDTYARAGLQPLIGTDTTGANVFFKTFDSLVSSDTDGGQLDIYDARICTSSAPCIKPPPPPTGCSADTCQAAPGGPPAMPTAASVTFAGPVNATPGRTAAKPKVLTSTVRGATFTVKVKVPGHGQITIRGAGVRTVRRSVSKAGTYRVRVMLSAKDKRLLASRHKLKLTLRVAYAPAGASAQVARVPLIVKPVLQHRAKHARRTLVVSREIGGAK